MVALAENAGPISSSTAERSQQTQFRVTANDIRKGFADFMNVNFTQTGFLSEQEVASQKRYFDEAIADPSKWADLAVSYVGQYAEQNKAQNLSLYYGEVVGPLQNAADANVISKKSYREWIAWIRDPQRQAKEKKQSISSILPTYLAERRALASRRESIIKDPRFKEMQQTKDPVMKATIAQVHDTEYFLNQLNFKERTALVTQLMAALPVLDEEKELFTKFETELLTLQGANVISKKSAERWIARFKDPKLGLKAKAYFITHQFPAYTKAWATIKEERNVILNDPAHKTLTKNDVKDLGTFLSEKKFLEMHYEKKVGLIAEIRAALTANKEGKRTLHDEAKTLLSNAATAGYIGKEKVGPWLEHVLDGKRTIKELKQFIKDWAKVRFRFDTVEEKMTKGKVPQGFQRLSIHTFLHLSYAQRKSYVEEAERRLNIESKPGNDTPIQDLKGKVRHALDTEHWDEAQHYLKQAWPLAKDPEDIKELQSMERYLHSFGADDGTKDRSEGEAAQIREAFLEIETVLHILPPELQPLYRKALARGPECLQCVTTCIYNRTWCQDRGYLTDSLEDKLRQQSHEETANRIRAGGEGHDDGYENNMVDGFNQPSIRNKGIGPQNIFMSADGVDAFIEKADANKHTWSFWYWTNLVVNGVSGSQNNYVSRSLNHRIKRACRKLNSFGIRYNPIGPAVGMN